MTLRVFVADEHQIVRRGMVALVAAHPDWEVCGEAADGALAVQEVARLNPDVVVLDIGLPTIAGTEATRQILENNRRPKILLLSMTDLDAVVREALGAGARGFLLKTEASDHLVAAVEALQHGRTFFAGRVADQVLKGYLNGSSEPRKEIVPTEQQRRVAQRLAEELAAASRHRWRFWGSLRRALKYLAFVAVALVVFGLVWTALHPTPDPLEPWESKLLVGLKLKAPPAPAYEGNPDAMVWIDLHTAVYYCRGNPAYGKTPKGRFARQRDARLDHFEEASHNPCD